MTVDQVLTEYENKLRILQSGIVHARTHASLTALLLAVALAFFLVLGFCAVRQQLSFWWPSVPIPVAAISVRRYRRYRQSGFHAWRLRCFYERAVQRINGNWPGSGVTGEEFAEADHLCARDLQIVGEGSLFELLCITRTSIGQQGLADYLLKAPAIGETLFRQEAVRELRDRLQLRERVATLGNRDCLESRRNTYEDWLNSPLLSFPSYLPLLTALTAFLVIVLLIAGFTALLSWIKVAIWILPLVVCNSLIGLVFRNRVHGALELLRSLSVETQVFREGLKLLESEPFQCVKLRALGNHVRKGAATVRKLERLLDILNERQKDLFYGPSLVLLTGTQICMAAERWRRQHSESLRTWLQAWAEFEALNTLANYAWDNPDHTFPEFTSHVCFEARALGHPLLPLASCIANDVELGEKCRFYLVSGSNMSGKSTLLRTIGLNAVLARAGAPVRASSLRPSALTVCASVSIVDSLLKGRSRFMAEVDRLRQTIEAATEGTVLFLIDEIFSGTNSHDRRIAAEAVIKTLMEKGATGALSTHDLALCEIADLPQYGGVNVHMGSAESGGPLSFDYRLKPGITNESNALAIARMAGVPV